MYLKLNDTNVSLFPCYRSLPLRGPSGHAWAQLCLDREGLWDALFLKNRVFVGCIRLSCQEHLC